MKSTKVLLNISAVICFLYGALYVFSLVFIPVGVYCFTAGKRFSFKAEHPEEIYSLDKKTFKAYVVIASIFCFPFGLISIIAYNNIYGNKVKVESPKTDLKYTRTIDEESEPEQPVSETQEEKLEKLKKLENFRDKGIITEDEFQMAKEQLFTEKDK